MGYYLNPAVCTSMFAIPTDVVDKHLKLASAAHLRVLLWTLRNANINISADDVAANLKLDRDSVLDAFLYWENAGIICSTEKEAAIPTNKTAEIKKPKAVEPRAQKPSRVEIAKLGLEDKKFAFLTNELQNCFGRELRFNEIQSFAWLYEHYGMDISVLLMLVEYAISCNKATTAFIEKTAVCWLNEGVTDVVSAEKMIVALREKRSAWGVVETAMGIEHRQPSDKELELANLWVNEWNFGRDVLKAAYDACIDSTAKLSFPYIKKILEGWHKQGIKTAEDIAALENSKPTTQNGTDKNYFDIAKSMMFTDEDKE